MEKRKVTQEECDMAFAGVVIFAHSIEKFMRIAEEYYVQKTMEGKEYKEIVNRIYQQKLLEGASRTLSLQLAQRDAEVLVRNSAEQEVEGSDVLPYKEYMQQLRKVIDMTEGFTSAGMENNTMPDRLDGVFDEMMKDSNTMCRLFCRFQNIDGKDAQAEEAVMRYEEKGLVSEEMIEEWFNVRGV